jgi:ABC-2 type transport system ATP-binding protein
VEFKNKKIKELSKGNQQKIQFICSLINEPKLLILDEPFSGLDPINTELFSKTIQEFKAKGSMIIFSSHQLDYVESFCEKVIVLEKGNVILSGNLLDIKKEYKKSNIIIDATVSIDELLKIPGVISVNKNQKEYIVNIASDEIIKSVFDYVKTCEDVRKFEVELPKLSEIFISKVGESREKV